MNSSSQRILVPFSVALSILYLAGCELLATPQLIQDFSKPSKDIQSATNLEKAVQNSVHPVLGTRGGDCLNGRALNRSTLRRLNNMTVPDGIPTFLWSHFFKKVEIESATQICRAVLNLPKPEVESLLGHPVYRGGKVDCWKFSKDDEDTWVYSIGGNAIHIRLIFHDGKCIQAAICDLAEESDFDNWRAERLCKLAVGKSVAQIIDSEGPFTRAKSNISIFYDFSCYSIELIIKDGVCAQAKMNIVAH